MIFYYRLKGTIFFYSKGTIPHHRPQRDDISSSSLKGDIYHRPQGTIHHHPKGTIFFIIIPRDDSSLSSPKGRFIIIIPSGMIFYHCLFWDDSLSSQKGRHSSSF